MTLPVPEPALKMNAAELLEFLRQTFPHAASGGATIESVDAGGLVLALDADEEHLRPGGTLSGPTFMWMVDLAMYLAILSRIGPMALAVTTNLEIHFLRKSGPARILAKASILKLGKRLAVGNVTVTTSESDEPLAFATVTYALPGDARP